MVQNGLKLIDAHASDVDFQKQKRRSGHESNSISSGDGSS